MLTIEDIDLRELIERETGQRFNREGAILCPFHNEKTPSFRVRFNSNKNKCFYTCFGCGNSGDAIDFIKELKGMDFKQARQYLGIEEEKTEKELELEKVHGYINWELEKFRQGQELLGVFQFTGANGQVLYYKAKFGLQDGKKQLSYYCLEDNKVVAKRGADEVPYNLFGAIQGIKEGKTLIVVEGEKDANRLNSALKNDYVATSFKGCKNIDVLLKACYDIKCMVIPDTGEAGEKYKWHAYKLIKKACASFKFVNLPGMKQLGDNKDVTDWLEAGHDKKDLLEAFNRSLDIMDNRELQQNREGIYKTVKKTKGEEEIEYKKYITDFTLLEAVRIIYVDEDQEGVKLILKSPTGKIIEKTGPSTVFDDTKAFKNFLGTIDLSFKGKIDDLTELKGWVNRYFALDNQELYAGVTFIERDGEINLVTNDGAISSTGIDLSAKCSTNQCSEDIASIGEITADEMQELRKRLFEFAAPEKTLSMLGTVINNLAVYQCEELGVYLHHLLIVGESGCGKSTILENVIAPILNYDKQNVKSIGLATQFALTKDLSTGNYSTLYDEFKPSFMDRKKVMWLSDILRNAYVRNTVSKGNKAYQVTNFKLKRPMIIAGEESYPNEEKALVERSCIVYLSKFERTLENTEAMNWLMENEHLLNKLGKSLIDIVLNLSIEEYQEIRNKAQMDVVGLKDRVERTAVNICSGIGILNVLMKKLELKEFEGYGQKIVSNIDTEILQGGDVKTAVEQMLVLFNDMIEDGRVLGIENIVVCRGDGLFIRTSAMVDLIQEHVKRFESDVAPLRLKDFKRQASKSSYLLSTSSKVIKVDRYGTGAKVATKFDQYNETLVRNLKLTGIAPELSEEVEDKKDDKVIFGKFNL